MIFITGYSIRAPQSRNPKEFYSNLLDGVDLTSPSVRYPVGYKGLPPRTGTLLDIDKFDQEFFKFSTKQTDKLDVAIRLFLEVSQEAIMDAQLSTASLRGSRTGVYVGHCFSDFACRTTYDDELNGYEIVNCAHTMAANKVSYHFDLKGPSLSLDTACSSSLVAFHQACSDLKNGTIDRAIVGGLSLTLDPAKNASFNAFSMLSPDGRCYSFDTRANGYCRSEGIAAIVLESSRVRVSGIARVLGSSVNCDGHKENGITYPSAELQAANAQAAFDSTDGEVTPASVSFIEAHGTGTVAGDKEELEGFVSVFYGDGGKESRGRGIPIGSVKSCMGHAEGASGLMSLVKCLLMFENETILPNQNFEQTVHRPILDGKFRIVTKAERWQPGICCISNYGFGGTNAFAIIGPMDKSRSTRILPGELPRTPFSNSALTDFDLVSTTWFQEQVMLGNDTDYRFRDGYPCRKCPSVCFLFGGQGSQWLDMGKKLFSESMEFRDTIRRLDGFLRKLDVQLSLQALYETGSQWTDKRFSALGIISYQIATVNIMRTVGLDPDFVIGHSLGEIGAGYASGYQSEEVTIGIAYARSLLSAGVKKGFDILRTKRECVDLCERIYHDKVDDWFYFYIPENTGKDLITGEDTVFNMVGSMAVIGLDAEAIQGAIDELNLSQTVLACYNSPSSQTVSGPAHQVDKLKTCLLTRDSSIRWHSLDTDSVAYHSPIFVAFSGMLIDQMTKTDESASTASKFIQKAWIPTSTRIDDEEVPFGSPKYHLRNIVNPVFFQQAVEQLPPNTVVLEMGSSSSLLGQVKRIRHDLEVVGLVNGTEPQTELIYLNAPEIRRQLWKSGYTKSFGHLAADHMWYSRGEFSKRWPDLWNHSKQQHVYAYKDFGKPSKSTSGGNAGLKNVIYSLQSEHKFLLDHQINGRALFPATGHIYTMWASQGFDQGICLKDIQIDSAIVLDDIVETDVVFQVAEMDGRLAVLHNNNVVARCRFEVIAQPDKIHTATTEASGVVSCGIPKKQWYMHLRRYGYEYQDAFQLVEEISETRPTASVRFRSAKHVIAYLDNFLQVMLLGGDEGMHLPTLLRKVVLHPNVISEAGFGSTAECNTVSKCVVTKNVLLQGLLVTAAAPRLRKPLVHWKHTFVPLEHRVSLDKSLTDLMEKTSNDGAERLRRYIAENPCVLQDKPWLSRVLQHADARCERHGVKHCGAEKQHAYENSILYRIYSDLYRNLPRLLESTLLTISTHPDHESLYENDPLLCGNLHDLACFAGVVKKEWNGVELDVLECGAGSCGLTRRLVPLVESQLSRYTCSDISAIRLGSLETHEKVTTSKHDLNLPLESSHRGKYHLIAGNNAIHTARNIRQTLLYLCSALYDGGFILLEELLGDYPLYLWGLDRYVWETPEDSRGYGLWMSWSEWEAVISSIGNLELLVSTRTDYRASMLLRKTVAIPQEVVVVEWADAREKIDNGTPVLLSGFGADGLVKTIRKEKGSHVKVRALVALGEEITSSHERHQLPLMFNHIQHGQVGSLVPTPVKMPYLNHNASNYALRILKPGDLSSLVWIQKPDDAEYSVSVKYSALNFRDVMVSLGRLRGVKPSIGIEFSGTDLLTGKCVMGIGSDCIASKVKPLMQWEVPRGVSLEDASSLPVAYATCLFALFVKASLKAKQTVLVHAGSGAVGHAAIRLCQRRGLRVFTTCSAPKRNYMKQTFGLDDSHIGNSRDSSFKDMILEQTKGVGVDCVLNSLSSDSMLASLECVKEYGHFCELGKYDLENNTLIGLKSMEKNVSYHVIDLTPMFTDPCHAAVITEIVDEAIKNNELIPMPIRTFGAEETEDALRFLSGGKHIGKVVVEMESFKPSGIKPRFCSSGVHVIIGGLGGFGLELAAWLLEHGASCIVTTSRSGIHSAWQRYRVQRLQRLFGRECIVVSLLDVAHESDCRKLLFDVVSQYGSLKGVWHAAMVLEDSLFENMNQQKWNVVNDVKVNGLKNLDRLTRKKDCKLDAFVMFSSTSSLFGMQGQSNYSHANSACEMIIEERNLSEIKPKGLAVQWGTIENVGYLATEAAVGDVAFQAQNIDDSLDCLNDLLCIGGTVSSFSYAEKDVDVALDVEITIETVQAKVAEILGGSAADYDPDTPLWEYGADSLSRMEILSWINKCVQKKLTLVFMTTELTVRDVYNQIRSDQIVAVTSAPKTVGDNNNAKTELASSRPVDLETLNSEGEHRGRGGVQKESGTQSSGSPIERQRPQNQTPAKTIVQTTKNGNIMSLQGKNIIITGATSGLGVAIASILSKEGADVFGGGRRADRGAQVAKDTQSTFHTVDVSSQESNRAFFAAADAHFGSDKVDFILLNAGVDGNLNEAQVKSLNVETYDNIYDTNVRGIILGLQYGTPLLRKGGTFVFTSSAAASIPFSTNPVYASSKSAVDSLARSFAAQFADSEDERIKSLSVLTINPTLYSTEMSQRFLSKDKMTSFATTYNPCRRVGKAEELASLVLELIRGNLPYKSGENVAMDADTYFPLDEYVARAGPDGDA